MSVSLLRVAARDRLCDLTSREGDWFLDELCTMSGNVSQMIGLMEMSCRVWQWNGKGVVTLGACGLAIVRKDDFTFASFIICP